MEYIVKEDKEGIEMASNSNIFEVLFKILLVCLWGAFSGIAGAFIAEALIYLKRGRIRYFCKEMWQEITS